MTTMVYDYFDTPVGPLLVAADDRGLRHIEFERNRYPTSIGSDWRRDPKPMRAAKAQLDAYFAGELTEFDLELAPDGTAFQTAVWSALCRIPYGATVSYGDIARDLGAPKAVRAVGAANGRNPLPIIVPCHRVIGANGSLTGFGGGLPVKKFLLEHEQRFAKFALT
jgi:methylated-DNA-[protein]-cysteine S-methyltransferase